MADQDVFWAHIVFVLVFVFADPDVFRAQMVFALVFVFAVFAVVGCVLFINVCTGKIKGWWGSPRMRLFRLGGVTTLRRKLNYACAQCQDSMEAGEKVRTLSCNHVFHCGGTVKCELGIDQWLLTGGQMSWRKCPVCREVPHRVPLWKRPPPSSPAPSPSASAPELQQLPRTSSTQDLETALLPPPHDDESETPPEAASSLASAPALQQLPRTSSTQDLEAASPLLAHDETLPEDSSSQ